MVPLPINVGYGILLGPNLMVHLVLNVVILIGEPDLGQDPAEVATLPQEVEPQRRYSRYIL